jgi:methyl-accepting chemotaxis protein
MEKVTQSSAATAEESAAASEELNAQAETSMSVVRSLAALVGGVAESGAAQPARRRGSKKSQGSVFPMPQARATESGTPTAATGTYGRF